MKIVKGDTVYVRSGKDVAGISRLQEALTARDARYGDEAAFQEAVASMPMKARIETANEARGVRGKVLRVLRKEGKVVVEGVNKVTKHQRPRATGGAAQVQQGGRIQFEAPIPISRVMLVCSNCHRPTRVTMRVRQDTRGTLSGEKTVQVRERVCKKCQEVIQRPTETTTV